MTDPMAPFAAAPPGWMTFEFPGNERTRSLLRIESLMKRCREFIASETHMDHQAALWSLFELFDLVGGRGDIKSELLQELERQRSRLNQYSGKPGVSDEALTGFLEQLQNSFTDLSTAQTRLGPHIMEVEWLQLLKGRFGIPGGICEFDVPSLHVWLHRPVEVRQTLLNGWLLTLRPVYESAASILRLLREGTQSDSYVATNGFFQLNIDGRQSQLIRVAVPKQPEVVAEISANKYVVSVRFRQLEANMHLKACEQDIAFQLSLCNF